MSFLNTALDRADRRQQAVEIRISPRENSLTARAADLSFTRRLELPDFYPHHLALLPAAEVAVQASRAAFCSIPAARSRASASRSRTSRGASAW